MKNTAKFQLNHFFKNTPSSVFNQFKHFLAPQSKNKNQKNAQTPTGIMISTKKQFHLLGENQRQPSPSLTNQTL
jgi:histone deacetylase complex regulatory component SIN3